MPTNHPRPLNGSDHQPPHCRQFGTYAAALQAATNARNAAPRLLLRIISCRLNAAGEFADRRLLAELRPA